MQESTQTIRLAIKGMSCNSCSANIQKVLNKEDSILEAEVFFLTHSAVVRFDIARITQEEIIQIIHNLGYHATMQEKTSVFTTTALNTQNTASFLKPTQVQKPMFFKTENMAQEIVNHKKIELHNKAELQPERINQDEFPQHIQLQDNKDNKDNKEALSFRKKEVLLDKEQKQDNQACCTNKTLKEAQTKKPLILKMLLAIHDYIENTLLNTKRRLYLSIFFTLSILYVSMGHMFGFNMPDSLLNVNYNAVTQLFITLCVMHFGRNFYIRGLVALRKLYPNMDSLVALGSLAGFFYSFFALLIGVITSDSNLLNHIYFESVCVILCFVMIGKFIEENAKHKAMRNAQALLQKREDIVYKILDLERQITQEINIETLCKGDYVKVSSYAHIPADGILYSKEASIDESMLSGESLPIAKKKEDNLYAGTLNLSESLIMQVQASPKDSTLARIYTLIQQSYESKAQIAKLADRVSSIFVPIVIILASSSFFYWLFASNLQNALIFFASTLLISCPCALGLATPMSILFANARANKMGIFFKNAQSLETIAKCDYVLFDKTGTLTQRDFALQKIEIYENGMSEDELLKITASIESTSNHVIANSICKIAKHLELLAVSSSETFINQGIKAVLQRNDKEESFILGSKDFVFSYALKEELEKSGDILESKILEGLHIYIAKYDDSMNTYRLLGRITLQEKLKDDARKLIEILQKQGIDCEILSGDHEESVKKVASELQVPYKASCTPKDKFERVQELQKNKHKVVMIGDGINDAIAIAKADVSIVMASGSAVSIEHGDIIYFSNSLANLANVFYLGRVTLQNIKQNLGFAFMYNIICIPLAMGVFARFGVVLNPMFASFAMSLSSLSVIANSMRLYKIQIS